MRKVFIHNPPPMTLEEQYIRACMYALGKMKDQGSCAIVVSAKHDYITDRAYVDIDDCLTWLDNKLANTEKLKQF